MPRLILVLTAALCIALPVGEAQAGRFTCKAAQNLARTSAPDRDTVLVEPDDVKKSAGSASTENRLEALRVERLWRRSS